MGNSEEKFISSILSEKKEKFPDFEIKEGLLCEKCNKKEVPDTFQLSGMKICRNCYNIEMENEINRINELLKTSKVIFDGNEILKNKLYLGNYYSATQKEELKKRGITHILMVGYLLHEFFPDDFEYATIEIEDDERENIFKYFYTCINFIEKSKVCYVHCQAGVSRSASIVIAYVMYKLKLKFEDALKYVKEKRDYIYPNAGFRLQLKDLENVLTYCQYDLEKFRQIHKHLFEKKIFE
jgi:protein-tyrosine phosphatase